MANLGALKFSNNTVKLGDTDKLGEVYRLPDGRGRFGRYGGRYVGETVVPALQQLEVAWTTLSLDPVFWADLRSLLHDYAGRETPLYFAQRLTRHYCRGRAGGPLLYLKREDLAHTGSHSMNNALGQVLLATRLGKRRIITETGSGLQGIAAAAASARLGLDCAVYMGARDIDKNPKNAERIKLLGAELLPVHSGLASLKDATSEAMRDFITNIHSTHHLESSVIGPHPFPMLVRNFQKVIGQETRRQALEKWGSKPDVLLSYVGRGSSAIGLFHEFIDDKDVQLIGVEAGGRNDTHACTLTKGELGVFHGAMTYLLQDAYGQTQHTHSISCDLNYPSVGPELSHLKDIGRVHMFSASDKEAFDACKRLAKLEGIIPSLASSHALAYLDKLCPTLKPNMRVVVNCSGNSHEYLPKDES